MNKTLVRLFLTNLTVLMIGLFIFGVWHGIPAMDYLGLFAVGSGSAFILTLMIEQIFLKPIQQMQQLAQKITQGDFNSRLSLMRKDELGDLANYLNQMSFELQNKINEVTRDKNELKAMLSSMIEGVIVINRNEKIVLLSAPVYEMLELRSREVIGKPYWEVIRNEEINSLLEEAMVQKHSVQKEITIIAPEERQFSVQVSSVLLESGDLSGVVAVFHDITELKKMAKVRAEFVANVSHEFKTPLTTIRGFVETLKDGAVNDKEKSRKFLDIILKHTERLEYLVNDLLSLASMESQELRLDFEKVPVPALIDSVVGLYKQQLEQKQQRLELKIPKDLPLIQADRLKIEQVFTNLLDNAIKFTPQEGQITIIVHQHNESVQIDFQDSGIGIDPQHLPRIFERFYRVDKGRSRDMGGTGLGLAIVKHIILAHQGKVSVQSHLGKGSTFSVSLPVAQ